VSLLPPGWHTFVEIGLALAQNRRCRLYQIEFDSFEGSAAPPTNQTLRLKCLRVSKQIGLTGRAVKWANLMIGLGRLLNLKAAVPTTDCADLHGCDALAQIRARTRRVNSLAGL
jgi:hypothetical protein